MLMVNGMSQKLANAADWVYEHRIEIALSVGCVATIALRCYVEEWIVDSEVKFREKCFTDSLPLSETVVISETGGYSVLQCGTRVFRRLF